MKKYNLKDILYQRKMKQVQLAKMLQIEPSTINLWVNEVKSVPFKHRKKLAEILNIKEEVFTKKVVVFK